MSIIAMLRCEPTTYLAPFQLEIIRFVTVFILSPVISCFSGNSEESALRCYRPIITVLPLTPGKAISAMKYSFNELAQSLTLDGLWEFELAGQKGVFQSPGTWEAQGYPHRIDGPAHFHKQVFIPETWHCQTIQLQFDAVSYHVKAWVNNILVGTHSGLWTPFAFDVSAVLQPGENNVIDLTVYKPGERFPMRESLAGFLPDVAVTFGGIWQSARLIALPGAAISDIWLLPDVATNSVNIQAQN